MRQSYNGFDELAFDEVDSLLRRSRNRRLAQVWADSRDYSGTDDDDDFEDKWADFDNDYDEYDEEEWDNYSS